MKRVVFSIVYLFLLQTMVCNALLEKHFVIVTASYNNKDFYKKNIDSVLSQKYSNYSVIYTDDCSTDGTYDLVQSYVTSSPKKNLFTLIKNEERRGALANQYRAIHMCKDTDIIVVLDGDDWFVDSNVLSYLNKVYADSNVWFTFGQFTQWPTGHQGWAEAIPNEIVKNNSFRSYTHAPAHLRTFYAGLFKKIDKEDLMHEGDFFKMTGDNAMTLPMIEMARNGHFKFISKVLMVYNAGNPISDHLTVPGLQQKLDQLIRSKKPYDAIDDIFLSKDGESKNCIEESKIEYSNEQHQKQIGLLIVATGKYINFVTPLINSARQYFCTKHQVKYFVFTDGQIADKESDTVIVYQKRLGWPYDTMMRFFMYSQSAHLFEHMDYLFALDADMLFVDVVGDEILSDRVATQHPGFVGKRGTYETNSASRACVKSKEGAMYFAGGFNGGNKDEFLKMAYTISNNVQEDLKRGVIAIWHDESHLNRYFIDNPPACILSPSYCYPESWNIPYTKRLLALDKNHSEIRK